jgi:molybdate transport system substrate-binding protein
MRILALTAGLLLLNTAAGAVEVKVLAPGLIGPGFKTLAAAWQAKTGNTAVLPAGTPPVGKINEIIAQGTDADVVILPPGEFTAMAAKLKPSSEKHIGQVLFGLAVKTGAPHPDISTPEKFRAALNGKTVAYNDPAIGSLAGKMVDAFLKQPEYAGVKGLPYKGSGGLAVADGAADMAVAVESEEIQVKGIDIVAAVPNGAGLRIDLSGAILTSAPHAKEAADFLTFLNSAEAAAILKPAGIAP